jgi:hypothetical protein
MASKVLLMGLLILLGGIVSIVIGNSVRRSDQLLQKWPTVQGTILSSSIIRTTRARLRVGATRGGASPNPTYAIEPVWRLDVDYRYTVGGVEYIGHDATPSLLVEKIQSTDSVASPQMQSIAAKLAAGSGIAVHYNPRNPKQAYLAYIDNPTRVGLFRVGWICIVIGLVMSIGSRFL